MKLSDLQEQLKHGDTSMISIIGLNWKKINQKSFNVIQLKEGGKQAAPVYPPSRKKRHFSGGHMGAAKEALRVSELPHVYVCELIAGWRLNGCCNCLPP